MVPSLLTLTLGVGFSVLNSIVGGQALASIANISWTCVVLRAMPPRILQILLALGL